MTIPPEQRDKHLALKLQEEWPGILAWGIEGCLRWQAEGLNPLAAVVEATAAYLESEDAMSTWIADRCELRPSFEDTTANLFKSSKEWAELMGEHAALSLKGFGRKLGNRPGLDPKEIGHAKLRG